MRTATERQQVINERKRLVGRKYRLWIRDEWRDLDIFSVPVEALVLNADNRRFRAERLWAEEQLGRALDPENFPDDERTIESLLLDTSHRVEREAPNIVGNPSDDYESLKNDWLRRGQESPFWIRPDGTVRNGNRRLAMIKRQQREGGDIGLQWVEAVVLESTDVDEPSLLEIEQREQLTENLKVRYNDIDYLLALREAAVNREIDWFDRGSIDEVAGTLQTMVEKSKGEVLRDLYAIKYMDRFLEDSAQTSQYHKVRGQLERFRDVGRMMLRAEEEYPLEADRVLLVLFAAVRSGQTHTDIRSLREMFRRDRQRFDKLATAIEDVEEPWASGDQRSLASSPATESMEAEEEDERDDEGPGPEVPNYPRIQVRRAIETAIDGFRSSRQADILRILREIRNRLEVLSDGNRLREGLRVGDAPAQAARGEFREIIAWIDGNRDLGESV